MTWFIDRRLNGKNKSTVNRQRFLRRYKAQIKQSISEAINKRSVTDVDSGESVSIPNDDISEPMFHQGRGGLRHRVHPGNDHFVQNDRIERPQGGGGGSGSGAFPRAELGGGAAGRGAGGAAAGGYPVYNTDYKTKPSKGYTSSLPASIIFGDAVKAMAYAVIIFSPLLLLLAVSVFIHRFYTKDEYRQNAQAVFEAAKVYLSECRNVIPDRVYSGVLKACETEPEICFDGSDEDISAFMSNIAADRSKSYYSIKIQNGIVAESRFSISRRLLKGAECGGIYADVSVYHDSSAM